ncbi:MAG TPA: response regulator transcription factor [Chroococcales cyanobacterium]|jgi:DNA-binding response OmpR family regulator
MTVKKQASKVLVVDDDENIRSLLEILLKHQGYEVFLADNGGDAMEIAEAEVPDLVVADIMMPSTDGFELCLQLRSTPKLSQVPILLLTAKTEMQDKYSGFRVGADDYVTKPFDLTELELRIKALLRRKKMAADFKDPILAIGDLAINRNDFSVRAGENLVALTPSEFSLLEYLMSHAGQVISSKELLIEALDYPSGQGSSEIIRTHIKNIRSKLEKGDPPTYIQTVSRQGYIVRMPDKQ